MSDQCADCNTVEKLYFSDEKMRCEPCAIAKRTAILAGRTEFQHGVKIGDYVGIRYVIDAERRYGRIVSVVAMNGMRGWSPSDKFGNCFAKLRIRMGDGSFRDEHPEHVFVARAPQLKAVQEEAPISDLGQSIFDMCVAMNNVATEQERLFQVMKERDRKMNGAA